MLETPKAIRTHKGNNRMDTTMGNQQGTDFRMEMRTPQRPQARLPYREDDMVCSLVESWGGWRNRNDQPTRFIHIEYND